MINYWFTSDTHFNQERTLELSKRPFKSVEEMNETIIERWNEVIKPDDIVFHLGDFGDYTFIKRLNGKINLMMGNYEETDMMKGLIDAERLVELGFNDVYEGDRSLLNKFEVFVHPETKEGMLMSHKPLDVRDNHGFDNMINFRLFGHIHRMQVVKKFGLNVGGDGNHYRPYSYEDVMFQKNGIANHYDDEVFCQ